MPHLQDLNVFEASLRQLVDDLMANSAQENLLRPFRAQSLEPRAAGLERCLVAASEIEGIRALAADVRHISVVLCRRLDSGAIGEFYALRDVGSLNGAWPSIAAISIEAVRRSSRKEGATAVLLHELSHEAFVEHDVWFATFQNWHLLSCGFESSTFLEDVRDEHRFVSLGDLRGAAAAAVLAAGMATLIKANSLARAEVIKVLRVLRDEAGSDYFGGDAVALGIRLQNLISER